MFRRLHRSLLALPLFLLTAPLFAYTIYLKDGSSIQAKKKYRVEGDKAVITLVNGSESFVRLAEIDVAKTNKSNQDDYGGTTVVLDGPKTVQAPPPATAQGGRLSDLIANRSVSTRLPEPSVRPKGTAAVPTAAAAPPPRPARFYETPTPKPVSRRPYPNPAVADALTRYLGEQGVEEYVLAQGSKPGRVAIEATTASEASVFKLLTVAANALLKVQPQGVSALELTMATPTRERAGAFLMTPDQAAELATNKLEVSAFFIQNVQF